MKEILLEVIRKIQAEKKEKKQVPNHALYVEISNTMSDEIKKCLNELCKEKKIKFCKTLNDIAFYEEGGQKGTRC